MRRRAAHKQDMSIHVTRNRDVAPGTPGLHPTKFASAPPNTGAAVTLSLQSTDCSQSEIGSWLGDNAEHLPESVRREIAAEMEASISAGSEAARHRERSAAFNDAFEAKFGYSYLDSVDARAAVDFLRGEGMRTLADSLSRVLGADLASSPRHAEPANKTYADTPADPYPFDSPEVQSGKVVDTIQSGSLTFHRSRPGLIPGEVQTIRMQANRPLTAAEVTQMGGLLGYSMMSTIGGEPADDPIQDSPYSFTMFKDTTKGHQGFDRFERTVSDTIVNGSHLRTTNRKGAGTAGTREIDGVGDQTLEFEIYWDVVETW